MKGFGCNLLAYDVYCNPELEALGGKYVDLPKLLPMLILSLFIVPSCRKLII
jgi:hypothetical protein